MQPSPSYIVEQVRLDDIFVTGERRGVDGDAVATLAKSIERIGLQTPITIRVDNAIPDPETGEVIDAYSLVAGRHRLEAYRQLGLERIPAVVRECSEIDAELWEIAENLHRSDLTKAERDKQIRRYAELLKHAEEISRQNVVKSKMPVGRPEGVAAKIAKETGLNKRTVERALNPQPPRPSPANPAPVPLHEAETQEQWLAAVMRLWNRAPQEWRETFLARVA